MNKLSRETIIQVLGQQETQGCIECGAKYFHVSNCRHGFGLETDELMRRIGERAAKLPSLEVHQCSFCGGTPQGTIWVVYHRSKSVISAQPSCESCSIGFVADDARESGFLPGIITNYTLQVEQEIAGFLV